MNKIKTYLIITATTFFASNIYAQTLPDKVSHAEPLYLDLVRDLGAWKGEKELNVGAEFINTHHYKENAFLVEYEFAPINRLGFEVEADFSIFKNTEPDVTAPANKLECLRFSTQYSFFVSTKHRTTLAVGYTQILEFTDFKNSNKEQIITATSYNPFFVAAKRFGKNVHSLVYVSPLIHQGFLEESTHFNWQIKTSVHYVIPNTKNFVGIELNKEINGGVFSMTVRPQVKVKLNSQLALGFVTGIPVNKNNEGYSSFLRLIYEL